MTVQKDFHEVLVSPKVYALVRESKSHAFLYNSFTTINKGEPVRVCEMTPDGVPNLGVYVIRVVTMATRRVKPEGGLHKPLSYVLRVEKL